MRRWLYSLLALAALLFTLRLYYAPLADTSAIALLRAATRHNATLHRNTTAHYNSTTRHNVSVPSDHAGRANDTLAPRNDTGDSSSAPTHNNESVPLTRDLYVSGHSAPRPELCPALGRRLALLILVSSAPTHATARDAIRRTWGHYAHRTDVALAFFIGDTRNDTTERVLAEEDRRYADVVRGAFLDTYDNLTLKTLSMLEWTASYCPRVPRLLKADDDVFVNVPGVLRLAKRTASETGRIWGRVLRRAAPARSRSSKYFLPRSQWPGRRLPEFATGPAYLVSGDAVRPLLDAALRSRWLRLEDVLVTGVAATAARIRRVGDPAFLNRRASPPACRLRQLLSLHMVRPHEMFELWRRLEDGRAKC